MLIYQRVCKGVCAQHMALYGTVALGTETPIEMMGQLKVMGAPQNAKGLTIRI